MYGLPKSHKRNVILRLILSMAGSAKNQLAKWFPSVLDLVLQLFSTNCIPDASTFVETLRNVQFPTLSSFLCSFDIKPLYQRSHEQTIEINFNTFLDGNLVLPFFPKKYLFI